MNDNLTRQRSSRHTEHPSRGSRDDALEPSQKSRTSQRRTGAGQGRTSRRDDTESGEDEGDDMHEQSPPRRLLKRRRVDAVVQSRQDPAHDEIVTVSRPSRATRRPGQSHANSSLAAPDDVDSTSGHSEYSEHDEDMECGEDDDIDEDDEDGEPLSPEPPRAETRKRGRPKGSKNKKPKKVKSAPARPVGRPPGSKSKNPKTNRVLPTSSLTLVASGSAGQDIPEDEDEDDNGHGHSLPLPRAEIKGKGKKTKLDNAGPLPLLYIDDDDIVDVNQLVANQPCSQHIQEVEAHLSGNGTAFTTDDTLVLEKVMSNNPSLSKLAQILWARFGRRLYDLFKFGLLPDITVPGKGIRTNTTQVGEGDSKFTVINPYPARMFTENLRVLAAHPIWGSDMDRLRYVLMYTVSCRVEGHDAPIVPILELDGHLLDDIVVSPQRAALLSYKNSQNNGIASHGDIRLLCDEIKSSVTTHAPRDDLDRSLFLLGTSDVLFVTKALDRLWDTTSGHRLYQRTEWYYTEWDNQQLRQWPRVKPKDTSVFTQHLKDSVTRWRLDHLIRLALQDANVGYLYDVCEEHCPLTAKCLEDIDADEEGGPTKSQLDVVRGLIRPRYGLHLGVGEWRIPDDDHIHPFPIIRSKASSAAVTRPGATPAGASGRGAAGRAGGSSGGGPVRLPVVPESPPRSGAALNAAASVEDSDHASQQSMDLGFVPQSDDYQGPADAASPTPDGHGGDTQSADHQVPAAQTTGIVLAPGEFDSMMRRIDPTMLMKAKNACWTTGRVIPQRRAIDRSILAAIARMPQVMLAQSRQPGLQHLKTAK